MEGTLTHPKNCAETMLIYPIAVHSHPTNAYDILLAEDMGYQTLKFERSFQLDITDILHIVTLGPTSQQLHSSPVSCRATKVEEAPSLKLVDYNEDHSSTTETLCTIGMRTMRLLD